METQPVFAFEDPIDYLNYEFRERQKRNSRFSLRAWARQVGYANPSLLSDVLKKERRLKIELAEKLATNLKLKGKARRYFEISVLYRTSQSDTERAVYGKMLKGLKPAHLAETNEFSLDIFSLAADWYHWAILVATELKDFQSDQAYLQQRLGLDRKTVRAALERLLRLGLLTRDEKGNYASASQQPAFMRNSLPAESVRVYHETLIEKARSAVREQSPNERYLRGTTLSLKKADYEKACEIVRNAHRELLALGAKGDGDELYQLNCQLFRLSRKQETLRQ